MKIISNNISGKMTCNQRKESKNIILDTTKEMFGENTK